MPLARPPSLRLAADETFMRLRPLKDVVVDLSKKLNTHDFTLCSAATRCLTLTEMFHSPSAACFDEIVPANAPSAAIEPGSASPLTPGLAVAPTGCGCAYRAQICLIFAPSPLPRRPGEPFRCRLGKPGQRAKIPLSFALGGRYPAG
jgi:hypothetical protein